MVKKSFSRLQFDMSTHPVSCCGFQHQTQPDCEACDLLWVVVSHRPCRVRTRPLFKPGLGWILVVPKTAQNRSLESSKILEATVGRANHKQTIDFVHPVLRVLRPFESKNGSANWFNCFGCRILLRSFEQRPIDLHGEAAKLILEVFPVFQCF